MSIEGYILLHPRGHYALYQPDLCHELHTGDRLEVDTGETWLKMEVAHSLEGYYLRGEKVSFYPMRVYAKLVNGEAKGSKGAGQ